MSEDNKLLETKDTDSVKQKLSESTDNMSISAADEINKYHQLYKDGILTEEEFNQKKAVLLSQQPEEITSQKKKTPSIRISKALIAGICVVAVILLAIFINMNTLSGSDKVAYDLMVKAAKNFKFPSTVKLVNGTVVEDTMFANISAENALGVRSTSCYFIGKEGYILESNSSACLGSDYDPLHIDKINKKLSKELKDY